MSLRLRFSPRLGSVWFVAELVELLGIDLKQDSVCEMPSLNAVMLAGSKSLVGAEKKDCRDQNLGYSASRSGGGCCSFGSDLIVLGIGVLRDVFSVSWAGVCDPEAVA